jgi:dihydrofolate reductase
MITVSYYVACSLDGFIATPDGAVDWLEDFSVEGEDFGYSEFFESIDAMVMGSTTYEQVLGFGDWPYGDMRCWVLSQRPLIPPRLEISVSDGAPSDVLAEIEAEGFTRTWLVGGGEVAGSFLSQHLIDEFVITVIPVILGAGIPLFADQTRRHPLQLVGTHRSGNGVVTLHYCRAEDG